LVTALGGVGAAVSLRAVAVGEVPGRVLAARVELVDPVAAAAAGAGADAGKHDYVPRVTVYLAVGARAREVERIDQWRPLPAPVDLTATVVSRRVTGLKRTRSGRPGGASASGSPAAQQRAADVTLRDLVQRHHPHLRGRQVGAAVAVVEGWLAKTFMDNLAQNLPRIESFVAALDSSDPDNILCGDGGW
ncbi:hypothetical protein HK405_012709, partial [Cladochytrium tenue]